MRPSNKEPVRVHVNCAHLGFASLLDGVETKPFPSRGRERGPNPFPVPWLKTRVAAATTTQTGHVWLENRAPPVLQDTDNVPATPCTSCPGPGGAEWHMIIPMVPWQFVLCHPQAKISQLEPLLQFLKLPTSVHMPRPYT